MLVFIECTLPNAFERTMGHRGFVYQRRTAAQLDRSQYDNDDH